MSFIDKDQRITSWQTKTKHNFFETSVTCSFLSSLSLISFFLATKICLYFCFTELQLAGFRTRFQCEVWANMFAAFLQPSSTCRASDAQETYKLILFP